MKVSLINIFVLSLIGICLIYGIVQPLYGNDISKLSYVMSMIMASIVVAAEYATYHIQNKEFMKLCMKEFRWITTKITWIGLAGSVIGMIALLSSLNVADLSQISSILVAMFYGAKTMFNTLLIGLAAKLWTDTIIHMMGEDSEA